MRSLLILTVLAATVAPSVAFACADGKCDDKHCDMPHPEAAAAAAPDAVVPAGSTSAKLKIEGMTCGSCSGKVKATLLAVPGVTLATVDVATGIADVGFDATKTNADALVAAVNAGGHFKASKN